MSEFCPSFIIYARSYKETSLLLDVLTESHGMITLVANGARKNTSKFGSSLQPFYFNNLKFYGKNELQTLQVTEPLAYYDLGSNNICGLYLNELIYRILPKNDPCHKMFSSYKETIIKLAQHQEPQKYLRLCEKQLFTTIGYGFDFSEIMLHKYYSYKFGCGFVEVAADSNQNVSGRTLLSFANHLEDELYVEHSAEILQQIKNLMRMMINYHLGKKRLFSKEVLI